MNEVMSLRQPETRAIMAWAKGKHFMASASLHGVILLLSSLPSHSIYEQGGSFVTASTLVCSQAIWNHIPL